MNEDGKNGLNTENQDDKAVNANENKPKRFRDKALSVIQKIILLFFACLMRGQTELRLLCRLKAAVFRILKKC